MYSNIAFAITILGIFSILENFRTNHKFSLLRYHMLAILVCITISSFMDYLDLTGFLIPYYKEVTKFFGTGLIINLFYVLVLKKIPRIVIIIESVLIFFFIIMFGYGLQFPLVINNKLQYAQSTYHRVFFIFCLLFTTGSIIFNFIKLVTNKNNKNLYEIKIIKWVGTLLIVFFFMILINVILFFLYLKGIYSMYNRIYITLFTIRFIVIIFILFRPKFIDDNKLSIHFNEIFIKPQKLAFKDFEFVFYSNHYYLLPDANMEDLALKLNATKCMSSKKVDDLVVEGFVV